MIPNEFIPESIFIQNFNNIVEREISFGELTVITGGNGSGKTSVIEAFEYCLTGKVMRDITIGSIIRAGEKKATVTIRGIFNGETVEITRTRTGSGYDLDVIIGSGETRSEVSNPKEFLEDIVTDNEFESIFVINGHGLSTFLSGMSRETSMMLDKIFSINTINYMVREIASGVLESSKKIDILNAKVNSLRQKKAVVERTLAGTDATSVEKEIKELSDEIEILEKEKEKATVLAGKMSNDLEEKTMLASHYEGLKREKDEIAERIHRFDKKMRENTLKKARIKSNVGEIDVEKIEGDLNEARNSLTMLDAEINFWKDVPSMLSKMLDRPSGGNDCPLCLAEGRKQDAMKNIESIQGDKKGKLQSLLKKKISIKATIREKEAMRNDVKSTEAMLSRMNIENETFEQTIRELKSKMDSINVPGKEEVEKAIRNASEARKKMRDIETRLVEMETMISDSKRQRKKLRGKMRSIRSNNGSSWTDDNEKCIVEAERTIRHLDGKRQKLKVLKTSMKSILASIRERIMDELNPVIMKAIRTFDPNTKITSFEMVPEKRPSRGEDYYYYGFNVKVSGNKLSFDSLSTGQKALVMISIIYTMIQFTESPLAAVFFDEIDNCGIDDEIINKILVSIVNLSGMGKIIFVNRNEKIINHLVSIGDKKGLSIPVYSFCEKNPAPLETG